MPSLAHLPGEGETRMKVHVRARCRECGEPATKRVTYVLENARSNPASAGYGRDDISWCSDAEAFACDAHERDVRWDAPAGMSWCSTYHGERFPHMLLTWEDACGFWFSEADAAAIVALHNVFPDLLAELQAAEALIGEEWQHDPDSNERYCYDCNRQESEGHRWDCSRAAYFEAHRKREEGAE